MTKTPLWIAALDIAPESAEAFAGIMGEEALALTVLAPPRTRTARIEAIFDAEPDDAALGLRVAVTAALLGIAAPRITVAPAPDIDWLKKVAGDFPPLPLARWVIYGGAHRHKITNPRRALQIDASSAFGTGEHPTTRGCLMMLDRLLKRRTPRRMLDMGCGSGILAMAFARETRRRAVGVDIDADSVAVARENTRINGLQPYLRVARGNGYNAVLVRQYAPYDLIMANIFAGPLARMAKDLKRHLKPGGVAILAGLLNTQANRVLTAHHMQGLRVIRKLTLDEWTILALQRGYEAK